MGFQTGGIARGKDKEPLARQLGASVYIDSQAQDPAAELLKLGGARVILATAASGGAWPSTAPCWSSGRLPRCKYLPCSCSRDAARSRAGIPGRRSTPRIRSR